MIEIIVAIIGLGVGDYADPLDLNLEDRDKKVIIQKSCDETTTKDNYGQVSKIKTCRSMKTIHTSEEQD